jgi:hypothetical protein
MVSSFRSVAQSGWIVKLRGVGPVRFGMRIEEAAPALGGLGPAHRAGCTYVGAGLPAGLKFMVESGRIVRADVDSAGVPTASGAEVGMSEAQVHALYPGRLLVQPHKTDGRVVTEFRVGLRPPVEYVEGCG